VASAVADGIFGDIAAAVGSAAAVGNASAIGSPAEAWGPDGTTSVVAAGSWGPDDPVAAAAVGTWGPNGAASIVAGGGRSLASRPADTCCWESDSPVGVTLEIEEEEALISKGRVNTCQHDD
jgi:hypothetical protein